MDWYLVVLKKYAVFEGRARRKEYWMFILFNILIGLVLGVIEGIAGLGSDTNVSILSAVYSVAVLIPGIAVSVRRLHDTNKSGLWLLISLIPLIGGIILLVFMVQDSQPGDNQYGPNPKDEFAF